MKKVALLFPRFGPYHVARVAAAASRLGAVGIEVVGIEVAERDTTYGWDPVRTVSGFRRTTIFLAEQYQRIPKHRVWKGVTTALEQEAPDAVAVPGWAYAESLASLRWCRRNAAVAVVMSESTRYDLRRHWWKESLKKKLVRRFDAALVGGTSQKAYAAALGLSPDRVFLGYDVVDNGYFARGAAAAWGHEKQLRARLGLPDRFVLASSRFIEKKNLLRLIEAFALSLRWDFRESEPAGPDGREARAPWHLVLCGDGPCRDELRASVKRFSLEGRVLFPGFIQYPDLPTYYGLSCLFVHAATSEQWGLVVNEAMASSLPVVVSNRCGCAPDLVVPGANGYTFDPYDTRALADLLRKGMNGEFPLAEMGRESARIIAGWSPERFGQGLLAAVLAGANVGRSSGLPSLGSGPCAGS